MTLPGIGPIISRDGSRDHAFSKARDFDAWLGATQGR
jgi:hypothetical protein